MVVKDCIFKDYSPKQVYAYINNSKTTSSNFVLSKYISIFVIKPTAL